MSDEITNPYFESLLQYLKRTRGFDFTGYKRPSLMRRVEKRMQMVNVESFPDYQDYLEVHPEEFGFLFNMILINVTGFFRDPMAWEAISGDIVPRILAEKREGEPFRCWSAACASGEEAYTLAIVLAEAMGIEAFRERVKIYATDIDEDALTQARLASYGPREVSGVPQELLGRYFENINGRYVFHKELRRAVIFGRHDLIQDAPISRVDMLVCRNALMYFNAETQGRILTRFHFALGERGYLFLGKAEVMFTHAELFAPVDLKRRIFRKVPRIGLRDRLLMLTSEDANMESGEETARLANRTRLRELASDKGAVAELVVDSIGAVALINEPARELFGLSPRDVGRPLQDLEISYRPLELRSRIEQVYADRRSLIVRDVAWTVGNGSAVRYLDILITPLIDGIGPSSGTLGVSLNFVEVTRYHHLQKELEDSNRELETAYEELQSTNEELETTNEELQSTVEELETTNEELQSTNEELETMNEELQSTNEELQTINEELRNRSAELNRVNAFMTSILTSFRSGVVVLNRELQVQVWNYRAEDMWGLRGDEVVGRHFLNVDIGLSVNGLVPMIRACLTGDVPHREVQVEATNRRGRAILCKVICTPLHEPADGIRGVILMMEESEPPLNGDNS